VFSTARSETGCSESAPRASRHSSLVIRRPLNPTKPRLSFPPHCLLDILFDLPTGLVTSDFKCALALHLVQNFLRMYHDYTAFRIQDSLRPTLLHVSSKSSASSAFTARCTPGWNSLIFLPVKSDESSHTRRPRDYTRARARS
jgi:hypothetical protein